MIKKLLKDWRFWAGITLLLFFLATLLFGDKFFLNTANRRLIAVAVIVFLVLLLFIIERIRAARAARTLEKSLKDQAEQESLNAAPGKKAEIEEFRKKFFDTLEKVKRTKRGKTALATFPIYMLIGPPAAGKTTALANSGLEFPFDTGPRGISGTVNCEWFFAQSAIFIDTAGRYMVDQDDEEWRTFLDLLKKSRRRQPISGVLVGMSIDDLLQQDNDAELETHATHIRRRLDELIARLGTRFPVYFLLTKCDRVQGFREFFHELNRPEREQIFGATFSPEQQRQNEPRRVFEEEFKLLHQQLLEWRMNRLGAAASREKRRLLYLFPHQFLSLQEKLTFFVDRLFRHNPYEDNPIFRGFYFTSGTQEGLPIDFVIRALAREFGFNEGAAADGEVETEKRSYFIKELFTSVIVRDQNLAGYSKRALARNELIRWGAIAAIAAATVWFIWGVASDYRRSRDQLDNFERAVNNILPVRPDEPTAYFQRLDELRYQLVDLEERESDPPLWHWHMYRGNKLLAPGHAIYANKFWPFVEKQLYRVLESKLQTFAGDPQGQSNQAYDYLRAYLLLGSAQDRLSREDNAGFLKNQLLWLLDENYFRRLHPQQARAVRKYAQDQIYYFVEGLAKRYWNSFENSQNSPLVQKVCASMQTAPTARGLYQRIIYGTRHLPPLNLNALFDGKYGDILQSAAEIPGVYLQKGKSQFDTELERALNAGVAQDWVCPQTSNTGIDRDAMRRDLESMYLNDYAVTWWRFLESVQYAKFDNFPVTIERLEILADPSNSPLVQLLQRVAEEMKFPPPKGNQAQSLLNQGASALSDSGAAAPLNIAEQQFADLIQFAAGPQGNGAPGGLTEVLAAFEAIRGQLESIQNDPFKAKDYAAKALQNAANDFPGAMKTIGQSTNFMTSRSKNVARRLLEPPVAQAWTAILGNAQQYLNEQWKNIVHKEFHNTLAEYYPFNKDGMDAPTVNVEKFFLPDNGTLWKFYNDELSPFLRQQTWTPIAWDNYGGISFSRVVLADLQRATAMKEELFRSGALQLQFSLEPKLPAAQGGLPPSQVCITIDGQADCYRMAPPSPIDFTWPRGEGNTSLQIITQNGALEIIKRMQGQWGIFHLLEKAAIVPRSSSMFDVSWEYSAGGYYVKVGYILRAKGAYNPFKSLQKNYFDFKIPAQLN